MDTEFWAERGMITLIDLKKAEDATLDEDAYTKRLGPGTFMKHAIGAMVAAGERYPSFSYQLRKLCDDAATACKLAKAQGDPTDMEVLKHVAKHKRKSSILVGPTELNKIAGPIGGQRFALDFGNSTPRDILLEGPQVKPDFSFSQQDVAALTPKRANALRKHRRSRRR